MKLGIGLPNTLDTDRRLMLDWARLADQAGFHVLGTIDKPNYDSWDPLATLAGVAGVTERIRLATNILQLPNRNEVLVAKQAAVIDRLSDGRLDLAVALGGRKDDFDVFGASFSDRAERFPQQVARIRDVWANARESDWEHGVLGPAPVQNPGPPIWIGAMSEKAVARAIEIGDGYIFGGAGKEMVAEMGPHIRQQAAARGKSDYTVAGLAYVAVGDDPQVALKEAAHQLVRYYGALWAEPENIVLHGPTEIVAEAAKEYEAAGLDILILVPLIPSLDQVERLGEDVLPTAA